MRSRKNDRQLCEVVRADPGRDERGPRQAAHGTRTVTITRYLPEPNNVSADIRNMSLTL
jgi:hypothetical protein